MPQRNYVVLDGYTVIRATEAAVCISKADTDTWLPRAHIQDGDTLDEGDTDIIVAGWLAIREQLDMD
jgi:hypothetical protein